MRGPRPRSRGVGGNGRGPGAWCDLAVRGGVLHSIKYSNYYFSFPCPDPEPGGQGGPGVPPVHAGRGHLHVLVHLRAPRPSSLVSYSNAEAIFLWPLNTTEFCLLPLVDFDPLHVSHPLCLQMSRQVQVHQEPHEHHRLLGCAPVSLTRTLVSR